MRKIKISRKERQKEMQRLAIKFLGGEQGIKNLAEFFCNQGAAGYDEAVREIQQELKAWEKSVRKARGKPPRWLEREVMNLLWEIYQEPSRFLSKENKE